MTPLELEGISNANEASDKTRKRKVLLPFVRLISAMGIKTSEGSGPMQRSFQRKEGSMD